MQITDTPRPKLPVFDVAKEVLKGSVAHFGKMVGVLWLPVILLLVVRMTPRELSLRFDLSDDVRGAIVEWGGPVLTPVAYILWSMIAVAWHRFVILGDCKSIRWWIGKREFRFLAATLMVGLPVMASAYFAGLLRQASWGDDWLVWGIAGWKMNDLLAVVLWALGLFLTTRLSFLLPAVALDQEFSMVKAWEAMQGNVLRFLMAETLTLGGVGIVASVPVLLALFVLTLIPSFSAAMILTDVWFVFLLLVGVTVLSVAYKELVIASSSKAITQ